MIIALLRYLLFGKPVNIADRTTMYVDLSKVSRRALTIDEER